MDYALYIIVSSVTILALVFLFLYIIKYQDCVDLRARLREAMESKDHEHHMQKIREDFFAMLVHELRSPLSVIKGSSDLIIREGDQLSKEQIVDMLGQIRSSSGDLLVTVNDLLDVTKIEAGRFEIYTKLSDVNQLLTDESHRYTALAQAKQIELKIDLDYKVKNIKFDSEKIKQVMNNLISNALKFSSAGGVVEITSRSTSKGATICVSDNGVGISDDVKGRLFNKFVQGHDDGVTKEKGTGLGLFIARGIVEAHGGKIWVEDNKPRGSRFFFTLPYS
ncbi:MAG: hypothetical protein ACD_22C00237G0012 [uncultured bacterium]|nr:MAG: hypothetical protein ACD_22C00237G0012 [uncultured bacterium]